MIIGYSVLDIGYWILIMNWSHIKRKRGETNPAPGVYVSLEDLIRIQFEARDFSFQPRQPVSSILSGRYASRLRGRGLNFEELRRYRSGDDIRTMDWKVTARTRTPHVRVYTEEKDRSVLVVVDQRNHMFFGTKVKMKSVSVAEITALALWRALDSGDRAGAVLFNDDEIVTIPPGRGNATVMRILKEVVRMNHALSASSTTSDASRFNKALRSAVATVKHDGLVGIASALMGCNGETRRLIARLTEHNDVIGVLTVDPSRPEPTAAQVTVTDGQNRLELDLRRKSLRKAIAEDYAKEQNELTRMLRGLSAPLLTVTTAESTVDQIRRLLGVR